MIQNSCFLVGFFVLDSLGSNVCEFTLNAAVLGNVLSALLGDSTYVTSTW